MTHTIDQNGIHLLATKVAPPQPPAALVTRPRLLEALQAASRHRLVLISASAGSGKTTLLSSWAEHARLAGQKITWLSLDALDNDPTRFWASCIAALRTCLPTVGENALALLHHPQAVPISTVVTTLINDILGHTGELLLFLDDYQVIEDQTIHESLTFLLDHLPAHLHLVLASRSDPDLPLARWRTRGQLLELRDPDLSFTPEETCTFLHLALELPVAAQEVSLLQSRTEGWIAGLQLATLALRRHKDRTVFLQAFTGSHRYLMDYVQQEVLTHLPEPLHQFLLQIAVLPRMNAELCQAVTQEPASQTLLETLERLNLFLVPLDEQRQWYRLHDLFREILLARLQATQPAQVSHLRLRAARYHEGQGEVREAVAYALAAPDFSYAASLMEHSIEEIWLHGETQTLYRWMMALPDAEIHEHARLVLTAALYLLNASASTAETQHIRARIQVEQMLARVEGTLQDAGEKVLPTSEMELRQRRLSLLRLWSLSDEALTRYDSKQFGLIAQQIQQLDQDDEVLWQMIPLSVTFLLHQNFSRNSGILVARLRVAKQRVGQTRDYYATVKITQWLIMTLVSAGQLKQAYQECLSFQGFLQRIGGHPILAGYISLFQANILYQWNRLEEIPALIQHTIQQATSLQQMDLSALGRWFVAEHALAVGNLPDAHLAIQELERFLQERETMVSSFYAPWAAALRARYWLATGNLAAARAWAELIVFSAENWSSHRIAELFAAVQVYLTHRQHQRALELLEWSGAFLNLSGDGNVLDTLVYLAAMVVTLRQGAKLTQSHAMLVRLLEMTEPEGYLRVYLDNGEPMRQALQALLDTQSSDASFSRSYVSSLLAAFGQEKRKRMQRAEAILPSLQEEASRSEPAAHLLSQAALVEPLSPQELRVLRLLVTGRSNPEIASALVVSVNTVKTQVQSIYRKLGVANRVEASAAARDLQLL